MTKVNNSPEIWKIIPDYPDYEASNHGRVRSNRGRSNKRVLSFADNGRGYQFCSLTNSDGTKNRYVHRVVAQAFISNPLNKRTVNHINLDKSDNRVENLEWATLKENIDHATESGAGTYKLNPQKVREIRVWLSLGYYHREIAEAYNVSLITIDLVSVRKIWGYVT